MANEVASKDWLYIQLHSSVNCGNKLRDLNGGWRLRI